MTMNTILTSKPSSIETPWNYLDNHKKIDDKYQEILKTSSCSERFLHRLGFQPIKVTLSTNHGTISSTFNGAPELSEVSLIFFFITTTQRTIE